MLDGIRKDYISSDQIPGGGQGVGPTSPEDKRTEAMVLMATEAFSNWQHPEHKQTVAKVNGLFGNT